MKNRYFTKLFFLFLFFLLLFFVWSKININFNDDRLKNYIFAYEEIKNKNITYPTSFQNKDKKFSDAEILCKKWTIYPTNKIDCQTGQLLAVDQFIPNFFEYIGSFFPNNEGHSHINLDSLTKNEIWEIVYKNILIRFNQLKLLRNQLITIENRNAGTENAIYAIDAKIYDLEKKIEMLSDKLPKNGVDINDHYKSLFSVSIQLEGYRYYKENGKFKSINWDIARVFDDYQELKNNLKLNQVFSTIFPVLLLFPPFLIFFIYINIFKIHEYFFIFTTSCFISLGCIFSADAANNYGITSSFFLLSPFYGIFERQVLIVLIGYGVLFLSIFYSNNIFSLSYVLKRNSSIFSICSIGSIFLAYFIFSPAIGFEVLKVVIIFFVSFTTHRYAREIFLIQKFSPVSISIKNLLSVLLNFFRGKRQGENASWMLSVYVLKSFFILMIVSFFAILTSGIFFGDFGGSLVTLLIIIIFIFLIFGMRLGIIWLSILLFFSLLLSQTDKVEQRIMLMIQPMTASVSDFARLISFSESAGKNGFGVGQVPWCSSEGICVPLQILSDYIPILLQGTFGINSSVFLFFLLLALFLFISIRCLFLFILEDYKNRFITILLFYLSSAIVVQIILSFFGNWRIIPLSGLSLPFLSIGLSSMIIPCLTIGLYIGLSIKKNKKSYEK